MAEGDDYNLDLSYMDESNVGADDQQQGGDYNYDDSAELYGDEHYNEENSNHHAGTNGNTNGNVKHESSDAAVKTEDHSGGDASSSRKRKDRDEDEYSETAQNATPRPASMTPAPSQHGGYGPQPTHALNIQQLGHNMSEESIREWANAVGKEAEIEELKFDEFKPNGKSKG